MTTNTRAQLIKSWEQGACSSSPTLLSVPKDMGQPLLLTQEISRDLDEKWSSWDLNWCLFGMPLGGLACHATILALTYFFIFKTLTFLFSGFLAFHYHAHLFFTCLNILNTILYCVQVNYHNFIIYVIYLHDTMYYFIHF